MVVEEKYVLGSMPDDIEKGGKTNCVEWFDVKISQQKIMAGIMSIYFHLISDIFFGNVIFFSSLSFIMTWLQKSVINCVKINWLDF